jgi:DNA mismatch endonuclease, patch repair protein
MADLLDPQSRSENMRRIRSKDTQPEMVVRRCIHAMGYRYRLHVRDLPGKPDLVFRKTKKVIFVHGCFWHQHSRCREGRVPKSKTKYWRSKLKRNVERDQAHLASLKQLGWKTLVLWECELQNEERLHRRLAKFLA